MMAPIKKLIEGIDFVCVDGKLIWTEKFLLERGFCCNGRCPNCPYKIKNNLSIKKNYNYEK
jgi:hypothetical protein